MHYHYGARARAGGTCLVAVLHAASVIGCWGCAAGAASLRTAPDAPLRRRAHRPRGTTAVVTVDCAAVTAEAAVVANTERVS